FGPSVIKALQSTEAVVAWEVCGGWSLNLSSPDAYGRFRRLHGGWCQCFKGAFAVLCSSVFLPTFPNSVVFLVAVTDKFTESMYVLANEPSVALYRLQEHVRRSLPELAQHKSDMQSWEEQSQGAIYTVEYACSAIKNMTDSSVYFKSIDSLLKHAIAMKDQLNSAQGRSTVAQQARNPPASS
ncbi:BLOC-1-related complex subunit 8, partial [Apteryx rowi]